jgi:hypothetical protein
VQEVPDPNAPVRNILRGKQGSIKNAPLEAGAPSWDDILDLPFAEIDRRARRGETGYRAIRKLLTDRRFDR